MKASKRPSAPMRGSPRKPSASKSGSAPATRRSPRIAPLIELKKWLKREVRVARLVKNDAARLGLEFKERHLLGQIVALENVKLEVDRMLTEGARGRTFRISDPRESGSRQKEESNYGKISNTPEADSSASSG